MGEILVLAERWRERLEGPLSEEDLARRWAAATPLPGGRGTARRARILGIDFILKREARGGLTGPLLPDRFLRLAPFRREWEDAALAAEAGLSPTPAARVYLHRGFLTAVYTLIEEVAGGRSLMDLMAGAGTPPWGAAGEAVARLHLLGLVHGDLNAGNLLSAPSGAVLLLDFRHSRREGPPPPARSRRDNVLRLSRSVRKSCWQRRAPFPKEFPERFAEGYAAGWGAREEWLREWALSPPDPGPVRRAFWPRP
jgi:tRNA A-37 threonylcarbamoyl transferase component Bud32